MQRFLSHPFGQAVLVAVLACATVFPHLSTPGLWDDDEGVNAECAREMAEADNWVVPTFNWELRTAKPVFLYWLLRVSYAACGVNEFAARLPSAIAFVFTAVLTYDLARRMFDKGIGLLAAVSVLSTLQLVVLGRGCTTDSVLIFFTTFYFWALWRGTTGVSRVAKADGFRWSSAFRRSSSDNQNEDRLKAELQRRSSIGICDIAVIQAGRTWFLPCAAASAFATLTKGPLVGLVLICGVVGMWFLWNRDWKRVWDRRMFWACLLWGVIAIPWYAYVAAESHGEWPKAFFLKENLERGSEAMEAHSGPPFYYLVAICLMFAPWSGVFAVTCWQSWRNCRSSSGEPFRAVRLLAAWVAVYLVAFSAAATKLPHYIAPLYPPLAILTAAAILRWKRGEVVWPRWAVPGQAIALFATGFLIGGFMLVAGTAERLGISPKAMPRFPGLEAWAWIGLIPIAGAVAMLVYNRRANRAGVVVAFSVSAVLFLGLLAAFPPLVIDRFKAAKELVAQSGARQLDREIVLGDYNYSQPSVTFYAGRPYKRIWDTREANDALASPIPLYLFVKAETWEKELAAGKIVAAHRIAARRYDFYRNCEILVVTNR